MRSAKKRAAGTVAALLSLVLAIAPALFVSGAPAQEATDARRTAATNGARTPRGARPTHAPRAAEPAAEPQPSPVRVPQLKPTPPERSTNSNTQAAPQPTQSPAQTASQPPPPADVIEDDEIITVTSNLVVVPASVTDAEGQPVQGLKAADFRLEEEGRAQEIAAVGDAEQVPLDIAILFDVSSSVSQKSFFEFQQRAAASFLKQVLKPTDRAAVITIGGAPKLVQPLASAETAMAKLTVIPAATTPVPTAFYDAVSFAADYLARNAPGRHRRVILVVSDGDDNFSERVREQTVAQYEAERRAEAEGGILSKSFREAVRRDLQARHTRAVEEVQRNVQRADVVFYSINPGGASVRLNEISTRAQNGMRQIADSTGGTAYVPARATDLETVFRQIASELRAQYLIQYYSTTDAPAGRFLKIKVATPSRPGLRVRARQGYYAKKG